MDEPVWLNRTIVEALHADQVREHGGRLGMRDPGLLDSALARPHQVWTHEAHADLAKLAAEYGRGLAKNHAFLGGHKRGALAATNVFLHLHGCALPAPEPEVVNTMLRLADGRLSRSRFAEWIRRHMVPHEE